MSIRIKKNVPLPKPRKARTYYPIAEMKVGDSFELDDKYRGQASNAADYFKRNHPGTDFTVRTVGDGKCRVWRTK